jgi:hypothetical protein
MSTYCEDYPCCGHTPDDPCARQPYDEPGYYDTTIRGNEHALCNHAEGECNVDEEDEFSGFDDPETCSWCVKIVEDADLVEADDGSRICDDCVEAHPERV